MDTQEILLRLLLGGLLGAVGQGLRIIVGLKKINDTAQQQGLRMGNLIETSRIFTSLLMGFCAGLLAMISLTDFDKALATQSSSVKEMIITIIASGYAGADFIEGFIRKYIPTNKQV